MLVDVITRNAIWKGQDDFPYDSLSQDELEKWLNYIKNKCWWGSYFSRLTKEPIKKRDEALAEIHSAFFLEEIKGFVVKEREPKGANNKRGEFILSVGGIDIFCEVKSPGWESEIVKKEGINSSRLRQGKHLPFEVRWTGISEFIQGTVNNAYEKFSEDKANLLIIVDDFWVPLFHQPPVQRNLTLYNALYYQSRPASCQDPPSGCFTSSSFENLSGVLFLNIKEKNNQFEYQNQLCINAFAKMELPDALKNNLDVFNAFQ
jgi:hypothetical protein